MFPTFSFIRIVYLTTSQDVKLLSIEGWSAHNKSEFTWKEGAMVEFEVMSRNFPGKTAEGHGKRL